MSGMHIAIIALIAIIISTLVFRAKKETNGSCLICPKERGAHIHISPGLARMYNRGPESDRRPPCPICMNVQGSHYHI